MSYVSAIAEENPRLSLGFLKRAGLFAQPVPHQVVVRNSNVDFLVTTVGQDTVAVFWKLNGQGFLQKVKLSSVELTFGRRLYFCCPMTGLNAEYLYMVQGVLGSSGAFGMKSIARGGQTAERRAASIDRLGDRLLGVDGKPKARGKVKERLAEQVASIPYATKIRPELEWVVADARMKQTRRRRRPHRSHSGKGPNSTAAALAEALHRLQPDDCVRSMIGQGVPKATDIVFPDRDSLSRRKNLILEDAAALDIRILLREIGDNVLWGSNLFWPEPAMEKHTSFLFAADMRDPKKPRIGIKAVRADGSRWQQAIELARSHPSTPKRWFMLCPITGRQCDVMYLRDGFFASPKAQRLKHRSQW